MAAAPERIGRDAGPIQGTGPGGGEQEPAEAEVASLVRRAIKGDQEAFGKLYDLYLDRVYRYVYYRVGRTAEAEDLSEEIFLKAWEAIGSYQYRGLPFGAWLFRLARNHVIDYMRTRRETVPLAEAVPFVQIEPESVALGRLRAAELRRLLERLTDEQREVIVLKFLEGLSTKEVAAVMLRQEGAVRALQMRALQALRVLIGDEQ